jgi:hypothetical protein
MRSSEYRDRDRARGGVPSPPPGPRARAARARARRRTLRRRRRTALLVLAAAIAIPLAAYASSSPSGPSQPPPARHHAAARAPADRRQRTAPSTTTTAAHAAAPSPGSLPQTNAYPSATSAVFRSLMAALWQGVVHDSVSRALPAFFPEQAYVKLKAISGAASDWRNRLVHDYALDVAAAHDLLGRGVSRAHLVGVNVVSRYGHWVPPGVCYNAIGYYEMPNARVVYREDGAERSLGIASMISWRGVWYVVHLGAVLRSTDAGVVDDPAAGPGVSAYSGTC